MVPADRARASRGDRLIAAYEAALSVAKESTPEGVLQRIVDLAREVVPARYAALGVTDEAGRIIQLFTSGLTPEERALLGDPPEGHGLLQALITDRAPLLIPDITADPRAVGLPPNHPPMRTLLGTPILLGDRVLGNLYLTEREDGGPFHEDDLHALQILAIHAATAIDRAQALRRVEEQRDQLRIILDSLPAGVLILAAPDERIELINTAANRMLFGAASPPGLLPVSNRDLRMLRADGARLSPRQRPTARALRGEVIRNQQILIENARGRRVPVLVQAAPLPGATGVVDRAVLVLQDITRLREAEQLKDDFLSLVSHEFRTPLTTIHGGAHLLQHQGDALDEQTRGELLRDIAEESNRLDRMLANMLILTDIMAGRLTARTEPLLVGPLVRKASEAVASQSADHTFVVDIAPGTPPAEGDPSLLSQVLRNLYENAIKYSPEGGMIRTTVESDACNVTIAVADEGMGITREAVDRVFERFYRSVPDQRVRGTGLGLYLSRQLIEAQGGKIRASSPGPGQGSVFVVTLPIVRGWTEAVDETRMAHPMTEQPAWFARS